MRKEARGKASKESRSRPRPGFTVNDPDSVGKFGKKVS